MTAGGTLSKERLRQDREFFKPRAEIGRPCGQIDFSKGTGSQHSGGWGAWIARQTAVSSSGEGKRGNSAQRPWADPNLRAQAAEDSPGGPPPARGAGDRPGSGNRKRNLAPGNALPLDPDLGRSRSRSRSRSRNKSGTIQETPPPSIKGSHAKRVEPAESCHRKTRGPILLEMLFPKYGRGAARMGKGMVDHPPVSLRI